MLIAVLIEFISNNGFFEQSLKHYFLLLHLNFWFISYRHTQRPNYSKIFSS